VTFAGREAFSREQQLCRQTFWFACMMSLVVTGMLNKQTSEIAVKVHRAWVMHKMQAESLSELVRMAEELHLSAPIYGGQDRFQRRCGSSAKIDGPGRLNSLANRYG
jgi:hypothetical protein